MYTVVKCLFMYFYTACGWFNTAETCSRVRILLNECRGRRSIVCIYIYTRVGTLIVATIYLQLIQNRYMFRRFTVLQCSHQYCVQPVASDVEVVGYL